MCILLIQHNQETALMLPDHFPISGCGLQEAVVCNNENNMYKSGKAVMVKPEISLNLANLVFRNKSLKINGPPKCFL